MEHLADQLFSLDFADWSAQRPCPSDTKLLREEKKATLSRIREVYASLLARGGGAPALPQEPQLKLEPGAAVEHDLQTPGVAEQHLAQTTHKAKPPSQAAPGPTAAPDGSLAAFPSLAALDECLTPANEQLAPGASGERRAKGNTSMWPGSRQALEPSAALTAQGLKLLPPANSPAEFLRQHVTLQPAGLSGRQQRRSRKQQQQQQQEAEADQPRQGRLWRPQSNIAKALNGKSGRRLGRGVSSSFAFSPFSQQQQQQQQQLPQQQDQVFGSLPLEGAAAGPLASHRLSRLGTAGATSQAVDALRWGAGAASGVEGAAGAPPRSHGAQQGSAAEARSLSQPQQLQQQTAEAPMALELCNVADSHLHPGGSSSQPGAASVHATIDKEPQEQQQQQQQEEEQPRDSPMHAPALHNEHPLLSGSTQPCLHGSQQALLDEYTLPPPSNVPPPVPFGSSTQPDTASLLLQQGQQRQDEALPPPQRWGGRQQRFAGHAGQQDAVPRLPLAVASTVPKTLGPLAAEIGSAAAQPAGCSTAQHEHEHEQQPEQGQHHPALQQVGHEDHSRVQDSQAASAGAAGPHATSPQPSLPPDSSPPFSWHLSPLPASLAAESAAAGACTPSFPLQGAGATAEERDSGAGCGAGAVWDSVPPTPAAMLDFTQTADEGPLSPPEACAETPPSAGTQQQRSGQRGQQHPKPGCSPQVPAQRPQQRDTAGRSLHVAGRQVSGQPPGAAEAQPDCLLSGPWAADAAAEAAGEAGSRPAELRPLPQAAPSQPVSDPAAAAAAAVPRVSSPSSLPALAAGCVQGLQLRMPTPALAAVATPDGRYAAVLLGSYGQYEPTEVVLLQLEPASLQQHTSCPEAVTNSNSVAYDWGSSRGQLVRPPNVEVVASVAIRPGSTRPAWPLNANSLQLGLDARGGPLLLLSAALEPDDLPANATRAVSVISFAAGVPKLELEIESKEPWWSLLWLGKGTFLAAGHGGLVQACSLKLPLRQYIWSPPLPTAVYHGYELNDLAQLTVNPCEPEILAGVSSDGVLALWNLDRRSLLAVHSSYNYRIQQPQLVTWERAAGASKGLAASLRGAPAGASAGGERADKGGPFTILAQLLPRSCSESSSTAVLGAVVVTGSRLTAGGTTVQVQGLTASTVCGDLCLAGTEEGLLHVWDLQSGSRTLIDALEGQRVTSMCHVRPAARDRDAGYPCAAGGNGPAHAGIGKGVSNHGTRLGATQQGKLPLEDLALVTGAGGHCLLLSLAASQMTGAAIGQV